jgi:predicted enzyme related to lactoylglutathione lyase
MKQNMVAWFEIPVSDMDRAKIFYEKVFDISVSLQVMDELQMGWFPHAGDTPGAMGCLIKNENYTPSEEGALLYFHSEDINTELDRVNGAGGVVRQQRTMISPEHGYMGVLIDSEGNRIALYSKS